MPTWDAIAIVGALVAVNAYTFTGIAKGLVRARWPRTDDHWLWQWSWRIVAIVFGAGLGIGASAVGLSVSWIWGALIGGAAGSLSAAIVKVVRSRIKALGKGKE